MKLHPKILLTTLFALTSCSSALTPEQLNQQLLQSDPDLRGQQYSLLLNFESEKDAPLVQEDPQAAAINSLRPHTGIKSLALADHTTRVTVPHAPLLISKPFPADWTLAGAYFFCQHDVGAIVSYQVNGQAIVQNDTILRAGRWTPLMVDLTANDTPVPAAGQLVFEFPAGDAGQCMLDDVLLVNNDQTLFTTDAQMEGANVWSIHQHGFDITLTRPDGQKKILKTTVAVVDGWRFIDGNALRARFESDAKPQYLTIYADGRQFEDGAYVGQWIKDDPWRELYPASHITPAQIAIPPDQGRLDRNSPGDSRNTGYNERLGSYELVAFGRHLEVQINPTDAAVARPVFEITGLPAGKAVVTLEGQLIEQFVRLPDGRLLIEIPGKIVRPSMLNIRVE